MGVKFFLHAQKTVLANYLKQASDIYYGLTPNELRKFAFQYGIANHLQIPASWTNNKMAGPDWYASFIKRNNTLSLRTPQATSLARAISFNKTNVSAFFFLICKPYSSGYSSKLQIFETSTKRA
jgi:hypothetical protein